MPEYTDQVNGEPPDEGQPDTRQYLPGTVELLHVKCGRTVFPASHYPKPNHSIVVRPLAGTPLTQANCAYWNTIAGGGTTQEANTAALAAYDAAIAVGPAVRVIANQFSPVLSLFSTATYTGVAGMMTDLSVEVQQSAILNYGSSGFGAGSPNAMGYTVPSYAGMPADPNLADIQANAESCAIATACHFHATGRIYGTGEEQGGTRGGPMFVKNFGIAKKTSGGEMCAYQFLPADAVSNTAPFQQETRAHNDTYTDLDPLQPSWGQMSCYNFNGVSACIIWAQFFIDKLLAECLNFTRHTSGPTRLYLPAWYRDDNESWIRRHFWHNVPFVNHENKTTFEDYNPATPNSYLGQPIPGYCYNRTILNHMFQADGVTELPRWNGEKIWAEKVGSVWTPRSFKDRFNAWTTKGLHNGTAPLPVVLSSNLDADATALGWEIQWYAFKRAFLDIWKQKAGYDLKASQYCVVKGATPYWEQGIYRISNFGWDEQELYCAIYQNTSGAFDINAGLIELARRRNLCANDSSIGSWHRIQPSGSSIAGFGRFDWLKKAWEYLRQTGVYRYNIFLERLEDQAPLYTAWQQFRSTLPQ